ncbi:cyclopropane-fatty-acyl-phospholipid synthase [Kiloniella laminariae]|uniref:Cyclopropane-fatty-acyl-phospholipid synthase n=1 Tax=Kiloniella laminariae TaxID=454162 RepID=A0ABT4LKV4_9PROT|nr:cyclopropane-fatty-acyl-phospholipid synthase family protein [Kiloniella laminariae]MCZ4280996.1 cyclopropane-fatty-acyl-phospholipid synthase [Kiloniella laminariae]
MISSGKNPVLDRVRRALTHVHEKLEPGFAFQLWDGSTIPATAAMEPGLRLAITDATAIPRLLRRPNLKTVIDLYLSGGLEIRGGSLFDLAAQRPQGKSKQLIRRLNKPLLLKSLLPLLFASGRKAGGKLAGEGSTAGAGSKKADIAYHYDVSNRFYELFLDPEMVYTCGYFKDWSNDLATAQLDKLEMICRKLRLKPGDRLLDIGCGWGALICYAAKHYGVTALGVTLSEEQYALTQSRIKERGLEGQVTVELKDFRLLDGSFDKISSIGMFEHVGIEHHREYYLTVKRLLEPRGLYLHHAITRRGKTSEAKFNRKRPEYNSMLRYIFPGAEVDHIGMTARNLEAHGFEVHDVEAWREHYAKTTEHWAKRLEQNREAVIAEAGEERYRLWLLYLTGVSLAFSRGTLNIFQTVASKRSKGLSGLPPTREDLYE